MNKVDHHPAIDSVAPVEELDAAVADVLLPYVEKGGIRALGAISDLSDQEPLYAAAAGTLLTAVIMRDGRSWRAGTRLLAAHLLATALRGVVKQLVDRTRPDAAARRGNYVLREGQRYESDFNSFPSGHTAGAVAVALAVSRDFPGARVPGIALAAAAGVAQVIRSKHYVSDVAAGAAIGIAAELIIDRVIRTARRL